MSKQNYFVDKYDLYRLMHKNLKEQKLKGKICMVNKIQEQSEVL